MTTQMTSQMQLPPLPPSQEELSVVTDNETISTVPIRIRGLDANTIPGKFNYINDANTRKMLSTAYQAINILELWQLITENPGEYGFMFSDDQRVYQIYNKIEELGYTGHSGFSFAFSMRQIQFIAINGEKEFKKSYMKNN